MSRCKPVTGDPQKGRAGCGDDGGPLTDGGVDRIRRNCAGTRRSITSGAPGSGRAGSPARAPAAALEQQLLAGARDPRAGRGDRRLDDGGGPRPAARAPRRKPLAPVESFDPERLGRLRGPAGRRHPRRRRDWSRSSRRRCPGRTLQVQSWNGDGLLTDDPWSTSMTAFLTASCKLPADLHVAPVVRPERGARCQRRCLHGGRRRRDGAARRTDRGLEGRLPRHEGQPGDHRRQGRHQGRLRRRQPSPAICGSTATPSMTSRRPTRRSRRRRWPACPTAAASGCAGRLGLVGPGRASCVPASGSPEPAASPSAS